MSGWYSNLKPPECILGRLINLLGGCNKMKGTLEIKNSHLRAQFPQTSPRPNHYFALLNRHFTKYWPYQESKFIFGNSRDSAALKHGYLSFPCGRLSVTTNNTYFYIKTYQRHIGKLRLSDLTSSVWLVPEVLYA
jgi:hypothetical protein